MKRTITEKQTLSVWIVLLLTVAIAIGEFFPDAGLGEIQFVAAVGAGFLTAFWTIAPNE